MKLPAGLSWLPRRWRWAALTEADRILLALSLSLLLHLPLLLRLGVEGSLQGQPGRLSVSLRPVAATVKPHAPVRMTQTSTAMPPADLGQSPVLDAPLAKTILPEPTRPSAQQPGPQPQPMDTSTQSADEQTSAAAHDDQSAQQLGLDFYYAARQVDVLAVSLLPIQLLEPYGVGMQDVDVTLRVFINEQGTVDAVKLVSAQPAGVEGPLMEVFRQARFSPAMLDGRPVKSFKLIRIAAPNSSE